MPRQRQTRKHKPESTSRKRHAHPSDLDVPPLIPYKAAYQKPPPLKRRKTEIGGKIIKLPTQYTIPTSSDGHQSAPPVAEPSPSLLSLPDVNKVNEPEPAPPAGPAVPEPNQEVAAEPVARVELGHNPQRNLANLQPEILNNISSENGFKSVIKQINHEIVAPKPPSTNAAELECKDYAYYKGQKWSDREVDDMVESMHSGVDAGFYGNLLFQNTQKLMRSSRTPLSIERKWKWLVKAHGKGEHGWNRVFELKKKLDANLKQHSASDHLSMLARRTAYREKKEQKRRKARAAKQARDAARTNLMDDLLCHEKQEMNHNIKTVKLVKIVRDTADKLIKSGDPKFSKDDLLKIKKMTMEHPETVMLEYERMNCSVGGGLPKLLSLILELT